MSFLGIHKKSTNELWKLADTNKDGKVDKADLEGADSVCKQILHEFGVDGNTTFENKDQMVNYTKTQNQDIDDMLEKAKARREAIASGNGKLSMDLQPPEDEQTLYVNKNIVVSKDVQRIIDNFTGAKVDPYLSAREHSTLFKENAWDNPLNQNDGPGAEPITRTMEFTGADLRALLINPDNTQQDGGKKIFWGSSDVDVTQLSDQEIMNLFISQAQEFDGNVLAAKHTPGPNGGTFSFLIMNDQSFALQQEGPEVQQ